MNDIRYILSTMVTQTPSSYEGEGEGEGLNFTREMIGIFNGEVELKF